MDRCKILRINFVYRFSLLSKIQNSTIFLVFQKCCNNHVGGSGTIFSQCKLNRCSCITTGRELTGKKVPTSYLEFRPIRCVAQDLLFFGIPYGRFFEVQTRSRILLSLNASICYPLTATFRTAAVSETIFIHYYFELQSFTIAVRSVGHSG